MKLISGSSNLPLAKKIASQLQAKLIKVTVTKFANDEKRLQIMDRVRGEDVVVVQSFSTPVDEHIIEFLLLVDALERMGANQVSVIIPWYGYSLQDKVFNDGEPLSAKVVANLISNSYVKRVFLLDVHNTSIAGFFSVPTHHLSALPLFTQYAQDNFDLKNTVVASPDFGGIKRAASLAKSLQLNLVNIAKKRDLQTGKIVEMALQGDVTDKIVLVFDDVIVSGGTVVEAAEILKQAGASEVHFLVTHGLLVNDAKDKFQSSQLDSIVISNSIHHQDLPAKVKIIDCAQLFTDQLKG